MQQAAAAAAAAPRDPNLNIYPVVANQIAELEKEASNKIKGAFEQAQQDRSVDEKSADKAAKEKLRRKEKKKQKKATAKQVLTIEIKETSETLAQNTFFEKHNSTIRKLVTLQSLLEGKLNHPAMTSKMIAKGLENIEPGSDVIVIGAQLGVEPLEKIAKVAGRLFLIDIDPKSLKHLTTQLIENVPEAKNKIITLPLDMTGGIFAGIEKLEVDKKKQDALTVATTITQFISKYLQSPFGIIDSENNKPIQAKYVVSSLVTSELFIYLQKLVKSKFPCMSEIRETKSALAFILSDFHLREIYVKNLLALTAPGGYIYFADTVYADQNPHIQKIQKKVHEFAISKLLESTKLFQNDQWVFMEFDSRQLPVDAYLTRKPE